ncbi:MAG: glucosaminidase domain-containing protein [Chloroflexi bacterium]|nr:glucosaminidase domain-containing protein [Chloroflexota bacterium]
MRTSIRRLALRAVTLYTVATLAALAITPAGSFTAAPAEAAAYTVDSNLTAPINITGRQLDDAIRSIRPDSGLVGLGDAFVQVGAQNGVNPIYLAAHAAWESSWGTSAIARAKNNLYGWTAYDSCPASCATAFASKAACIQTVVPVIKATYLTPGGRYYTSYGPTLRGMNVHYATDQNWKNGIASVMNLIAGKAGSGGATPAPTPAPTPQPDACPGPGCNGRDPQASGCSQGAITVMTQKVPWGAGSILLELRWSEKCQSNWTRAAFTGNAGAAGAPSLATLLRDTADQNMPGTLTAMPGNLSYSNMWYAPAQPLKACVSASGPGGAFTCTAAR